MTLPKSLAWETFDAPRKPGRRSYVTWDQKFWALGSESSCQLIGKQKGHGNPWILLSLRSYVFPALCDSGSVGSFVIHDIFGRIKCLGIKHFVFLQMEECLMVNCTNCSFKELVWLPVKVESFSWRVKFAVIDSCPVSAGCRCCSCRLAAAAGWLAGWQPVDAVGWLAKCLLLLMAGWLFVAGCSSWLACCGSWLADSWMAAVFWLAGWLLLLIWVFGIYRR